MNVTQRQIHTWLLAMAKDLAEAQVDDPAMVALNDRSAVTVYQIAEAVKDGVYKA